MKTYLPQIERRITVRPNQTYGILSYDVDNAYPQRMLELVAGSPTAKECWNKRAKFIGGNGFAEKNLGKQIINSRGLTLAKLDKAISEDKGLFRGFGIHVNYNANLQIAELNYVRFEDIRMGNTDSPELRGKFVIYNDWGRKTWKNIMRSKFHILSPFNPDAEVVKAEMEEAGGIEEYKGQLFYFNPEVDDYPLIEADSVWEDFETEAGIKTFNNREVTTGFLPSTMLFMKSRREDGDLNDTDKSAYSSQPSQLERDLGVFQGAKSAQKIIVIEYEDEESKPEFKPYDIQNNDKLFESTERSVEARIIKGFSVPKALITNEKHGGLNNNGSEKKEAIREFNDITSPDRNDIAEVYATLFANFYININPSGNWEKVEIPAIVAEDAPGIKAGTQINALLLSSLPTESKIWTLVNAYGFKPDEAKMMVPPDDWKPEPPPMMKPDTQPENDDQKQIPD